MSVWNLPASVANLLFKLVTLTHWWGLYPEWVNPEWVLVVVLVVLVVVLVVLAMVSSKWSQ